MTIHRDGNGDRNCNGNGNGNGYGYGNCYGNGNGNGLTQNRKDAKSEGCSVRHSGSRVV